MSDLLSIYNELQSKKWVDLTHKINAESPHFPALPALKQEDLFTLKDGFHVQKFTVVGQYGTHIDAPIHFVEGGRWLDEIALKDLLLPLYVIDKSKEVAASPNFVLSKQDILDFEAEHGRIVEGAFVAFRSDWSKRWPDQDAMRNLDENGVQQSGFHVQKFTVVGQYGTHWSPSKIFLPLQNVGQIKMLCVTWMKMGFNKVLDGAVKPWNS